MSTLELNRQVRDLFQAYAKRPAKPESALEVASDFMLDLINVFGDQLSSETPLKPDWSQFAPFEFILGLNDLLSKYKASGYDNLSASERSLLHDNHLLLGSLINAAMTNHPDTFPDEEHYQIPNTVAKELRLLAEFS
jgi:hypothetical protein